MFSCSFSPNISRGICVGSTAKNLPQEGILRRTTTQEFGFPSTLTMSEVELEDPVENIGTKLVRQAAAKTNDLTGDGTTTSVVLAQGPIAEGVKVELEEPVENISTKLVRQAAAKTDDLTGDGTTTSGVLAQGPIAEGVKVELEEPVENIGSKLVRQAAAKTDDLTGDGTTTSVVLAQGPIAEGVKVVAAGANPALITRGIEMTAEDLRSKEEFEKLLKEQEEFQKMLKESKEFNKMFGPGDDSLSDEIRPFAFVGPSSNSKVKDMKSEDFISGQSYVILRPKTNVGQMNPKGEEKIAEEKAICILCFAKLEEGDELLKSVCGCTNDPVHVTCADTGARKEGNICDYCGQEVHNEAVTLHRVKTTTQGVDTENKKKWAFFTRAP